MTEQQIRELRETLAWLVDNYGVDAALIALAGYASARAGRIFEVVEREPLRDAEPARTSSSTICFAGIRARWG